MYRNLVDGVPGVLYFDEAVEDGRTVYVSPRVEELLGYTVAELTRSIDDWVATVVHPEDRALVEEVTSRVNNGRREASEYRLVTRGGDIVWVHDDAAPVFDEDGAVVAVRGFLFDITARKRAEDDVRAAEERYRSLVEDLPGVVYVDAADATGSSLYLSPRIEDLLGYPREAWLENPDFFVDVALHPDDRERLLAEIALNNAGVKNRSEYRCLAADGRIVWVYDESHPQFDAEGNVVATRGFMFDITDRKEAEVELALREEQLRRSQRMESIGRLAGGVAHDFNNLLTVILGHLHILLAVERVTDDVRAQLEAVDQAAGRAAELTRQLLAFSRQQVLRPSPLSLAEVVTGLESMLQRLLPADIAFAIRVGSGVRPILADRGQIEQVVTNLVLNARDAMPEGGLLTVRAIDRDLEVDSNGVPAGSYVELRVTDTGHGMDEPTKARIFEPFFTTKETGQGTGLGLATVEGFVGQSGGYLTVESAPGEGTSIGVLLPVAGEAATPTAAGGPSSLAGGSERILLVEDDESVRRLVRRLLEGLGYRVFEAADPAEALRVVATADRLDLLLTDLVMPGGSGRALAEELARLTPGIGILFMSGYTDDEIVRRGSLPRSSAFLQKPFQLPTLATRVREALDQRAANPPSTGSTTPVT
jgi:PAS domain S-box-containing protein